MSESPNLDPAALENLCRMGGKAFVGTMIDLFLEYASAKIREAQAAHASGDLEGVANAVHPIRSSAGNVGAVRVRALSTRLEDLARQGGSESLAGLLAELEQAFTAAKSELAESRQRFRAAMAAEAAGPNQQS